MHSRSFPIIKNKEENSNVCPLGGECAIYCPDHPVKVELFHPVHQGIISDYFVVKKMFEADFRSQIRVSNYYKVTHFVN